MRANLIAAALALPWLALQAQSGPLLELRRTLPLPGLSGRLDHLAIDVLRKRLFVAGLDADRVEVVDLVAGEVLHHLAGCSRPQGLLYLPKPNLLYVANGGSGVVKVFDCATFKALKTIGSLPAADNLRYDAQANRVYVGFGEGALGVINPLTGVHTATLPLLGHPEAFEIEPGGSRVYVNVPQARHVAVLNRHTQRLDEAWILPGLEGNHAMALDEANHRLFVACRNPARLVVLATGEGKLLNEVPIGGDCDDLFHDTRRGRIYAVCGEGLLCVFQQTDVLTVQMQEQVKTTPGARTGLFVPGLEELFVAAPATGRLPAEIRIYRVGD